MNFEKILVIRLKEIGDALLSLPLCRSLRRNFPNAEIHYLVYEHIAPLFEHDPAVDQVQVYTPEERRKPLKYLQKMWALRRQRYDVVIDIMTVPITVITTRLSGADRQIGFDKGKFRSRFYRRRIPHPADLGPLDSKLALLAGLPGATETTRDFALNLLPEELNAMRERMAQAGVDIERPTLMFSPISRIGRKNWPQDRFAAMIDHCLDKYAVNGVLIWGPGERELVRTVAAQTKNPARLCTGIETANVRDVALLARNCDLFIGNDSGPRHIAEAAGIPTFTIFSPPVSKYHWLPNPGPHHQAIDMCDVLNIDLCEWYGMANRFRQHQDDCYRQITPEIVYSKLDPLLELLLR